MKYFTIPPEKALAAMVSHFWVSEFAGSQADLFTYFSTADSQTKIIFYYKITPDLHEGDYWELMFSVVQGQTQTHGAFPNQGRFGIFGVTLFPYAIRQLFAMPAVELSNQLIDLPTLLKQPGVMLNEQMAAAKGTGERVNIISQFLASQLARHYIRETVLTTAIKQIWTVHGRVSIPDLAQGYGFSQKQFERKFREWSGFTPKLFARIVRFEAVLGRYAGQHSLTEVGYEFGYYDQSHFIKDFKEFTGFPPTRYFALVEG